VIQSFWPSSFQRVGANRVGADARKIRRLLFVGAVVQQRVVEQRVLHVDEYADGGICPRDFLHQQDGQQEITPGAAKRLGNLDAHHTHLEQALQQVGIVGVILIHFSRAWRDLARGELAHGVAHHLFVFGQHR